MLYLSQTSTRTRELDKNMAIIDTKIHIVIACVAKKRLYKTMGEILRN